MFTLRAVLTIEDEFVEPRSETIGRILPINQISKPSYNFAYDKVRTLLCLIIIP